jgi:hypothetical protein
MGLDLVDEQRPVLAAVRQSVSLSGEAHTRSLLSSPAITTNG